VAFRFGGRWKGSEFPRLLLLAGTEGEKANLLSSTALLISLKKAGHTCTDEKALRNAKFSALSVVLEALSKQSQNLGMFAAQCTSSSPSSIRVSGIGNDRIP
jgi:hypothetical protein